MALLEVRGLRTGYEGIPVVFGVDLDVDEGEVVTLLGANGAGKTTTLRAISGMIPVMSGSIRFAGQDIAGRPAERIARTGLLHVPAGRGVFPTLSVAETLRLAAALSWFMDHSRLFVRGAAMDGRGCGGGDARAPTRAGQGAVWCRPGRYLPRRC